MEDNYFNIKNILGILFKITKKNANILADRYLLKEVSIISKWKNNKADIKAEDIIRIVDFAVKESSEVQRKMIRKEIVTLINTSPITDEIKEMVVGIKDFGEFLGESLNVCTSWSYDVPDVINKSAIGEKTGSGSEYKVNQENGIEGDYKGIVRFDLQLLKNKGDNQIDTGSKKSTTLKNGKINLIPRSKLGDVKKYIEAKNVFTVIIIVAILSYTLIQTGGSNKKVASDINHTQSYQSTYQENGPAKAGRGDTSAKAEQAAPSKKSDKKETNERREADNNKQKKSPVQVDKSKDKTINKSETNNNVNTKSNQQNNDININISGSSNLNIGVGNNIIISNNNSNEASSPSNPKSETATSSATATHASEK